VDPPLIQVAVVRAAHGIAGAVRIKALTGEPVAFSQYGALFVETTGQRLEIAAVRPLKADLFVVQFSGISNRTAAQELTGASLCVRRDQLPELSQNEYYRADLIGLRAVTTDGALIGEVIGVDNYGAGDILEIRLGEGTTQLIPFRRTTVPSIDLVGRRIVVSAELLAIDHRP
jgi:16S rRNA processing protein RimM